MLKFTIQARSNKIDIFGVFLGMPDAPRVLTLRAKPVTFEVGKNTTDPELALLTLPVKDARELATKILRAAGEEGS